MKHPAAKPHTRELLARALMQLEASPPGSRVAVICEGKLDRWFVQNVLAGTAIGVPAGGRKHVLQAALHHRAQDSHRLAFLIDRDFAEPALPDGPEDARIRRIVLTEHPSLETDLAAEGLLLPVVEGIIAHAGGLGEEDPSAILAFAFRLAYVKGRLRSLGVSRGNMIRFQALRARDLLDDVGAVCTSSLVTAVETKCGYAVDDDFRAVATQACSEEPDLGFCDGHDLIDSLVCALHVTKAAPTASTRSVEQAIYTILSANAARVAEMPVTRRLVETVAAGLP